MTAESPAAVLRLFPDWRNCCLVYQALLLWKLHPDLDGPPANKCGPDSLLHGHGLHRFASRHPELPPHAECEPSNNTISSGFVGCMPNFVPLIEYSRLHFSRIACILHGSYVELSLAQHLICILLKKVLKWCSISHTGYYLKARCKSRASHTSMALLGLLRRSVCSA